MGRDGVGMVGRWRVAGARCAWRWGTWVGMRWRGAGGTWGRIGRDTDGRSMGVDDAVRRSTGEGWGHALAITLDLVP